MRKTKPKKKQKEGRKDPRKDTTKAQKAPAQKARRIRLYPNSQQRQILRRWLGTARWTYNECLKVLNNKSVAWSKKALRDHCLNKQGLEDKGLAWVLETPYDVRNQAMEDLLKAFAACFAKGERFQVKPRSKKDPQQSVVIESKHWGRKRGAYSFLKEIKASESLPEKLGYDSRLLVTRLGHFYLCIPQPLDVRRETQAPVYSSREELSGAGVVALDPGVRTFQTCYDPSGLVAEWGVNDMSRIYRLCHAYDKLQSKWSHKDVRHAKRYRLKKAGWRIQLKIRNLVSDIHKKMVSWLCHNYRVVLLPSFETSKMVRKGQRRIAGKTARAMANWAHYRFKEHLLHKAREFPWCKVIVCDEHYTSKTCGQCGHIHDALGGAKQFRCPACGFTLDRDINGARNVLIRYLSLHCDTSDLSPGRVGTYPLPSQ